MSLAEIGTRTKVRVLEDAVNFTGIMLASVIYYDEDLPEIQSQHDNIAAVVNGMVYAETQLGGNITVTIWRSIGDGEKRKYDFTYDATNRLISANFNQYTSGAFKKSANVDFSEANITFDANGNIKTMNQTGLQGISSAPMDQVTYSYAPICVRHKPDNYYQDSTA